MRILHTSDWHLGRIFYGVHLTEDQAHILDQLLMLIKDVKPDVLLLAGDIFDRSVPPVEAVNLLDEVVSKIVLEEKIPAIMIAGNHDSAERVHFGSRLLNASRLNICGRLGRDFKPVSIEDKFGPVNFYSLPYVEPAAVRDILKDDEIHTLDDSMKKLMEMVKGSMYSSKRNVLITHTFAAGCDPSESERPLSVGGSSVVDSSYFEGFNYVALGHLHRPQRVGCEKVRYSGSLMKYSFSESVQKKHIPLVDMDEHGNVHIEYYELTPKRDIRCLEGSLQEILKGPQNGESREDYIMVTLRDEGAILDAMGKVREVYPNTLHIERPQFALQGNLRGPDSNFRKMGMLNLFSSFFNQVTDMEMSEEQVLTLENILSKNSEALKEG